MTSPTVTFRQYLNGQDATVEKLKSYLSDLDEWWNSEFKIATDVDPSNKAYKVREAVCALANVKGGEVFLGVTDDKEIIGTNMTNERLSEILQQPEAQRRDWYVVDLNEVIELSPLRVDIDNEGKNKAYILEVRRPGVPVLLRKDNARLYIVKRKGNRTENCDGLNTMELYRTMKREEILRTCYIEYRTFIQRLHEGIPAQSVGLGLDLPYLTKRMEDGSFWTELTSVDIKHFLGKTNKDGTHSEGFLSPFIELKFEIDLILNLKESCEKSMIKTYIREELRKREYDITNNLEKMRDYLEKEGIDVSED